MKPKSFEVIVEFTPQSTKTGITYKVHQNGLLIRCEGCHFWDKEPNQTAVPAIHLCRLWRIGTFNVDFCARASKDGWITVAEPKEKNNHR